MFNWMPGNQPGFLKASSHRNASPVALIVFAQEKYNWFDMWSNNNT